MCCPATALFVSGDPAAVGEELDGVLLVPTDANEIILDGSGGSGYTLVILSDGLAAAGGVVGNLDNYQGHMGISDIVEGVNELTTISTFTDLDGNVLAEPPIMAGVYAGVEATVDSGLIHSMFLDEDGNVFASGNNDKGQLCLGDNDSRETPFQIDLPEPAVGVAVGGDFTLILTEEGKVYGCGSNEFGQLGLGPDIDAALLPNDGNDLTDVFSISAGKRHDFVWPYFALWNHLSQTVRSGLNFALFMTDDGLFVTGDNTYGQLCVDPETDKIFTPSLLADVDGDSVDMFAAGYQSSYLLFGLDGSAASCGLNDVGQLGDGTTETKSRTAVVIPDNDPIINLGVGTSAKSAFFLSEDAVYATGLNTDGQLGINDEDAEEVAEPTEVEFTESTLLFNVSPGDIQTLYW